MFDRKAYKAIAQKQLQGRYGTPALATLVTAGVLFILYMPVLLARKNGEDISNSGPFGSSMSVIVVCLSGILEIAFYRLAIILSKTREKQPFSVYLEGFNYWLKGLLGILWMLLWLVLWGLCFYIPLFIKVFSYSQMFFILAEYPDISVRKAMTLSKKITNGYKFDLFVMSLSFLGWDILAALIPPLELWLVPYKTMAETNAYHSIKAQQIAAGVVSESDFSGTSDYSDGTDTAFQTDATAAFPVILGQKEEEEGKSSETVATTEDKILMPPPESAPSNAPAADTMTDIPDENTENTEEHFDE